MGAHTFQHFVKRNSKPEGFHETRKGDNTILRQKYVAWPNASEAFQRARDDAAWEHGHGGYTGTIAEKHSFVKIALPAGKVAEDYADELIRAGDPRIDDKWGPAGCIEIPGDDGGWLFFGWASS